MLRSKGGPTLLENLAWACQGCNGHSIGLGTYYADFLADELREQEATEEDLSS